MKEFIKKHQGTIVGNGVAFIGGGILAGVVGTFLGEQLGYGAIVFYLYGLFGHTKLAELVKSKVNK